MKCPNCSDDMEYVLCPHCSAKINQIGNVFMGEASKSVVEAIKFSKEFGGGAKVLEQSRIRRKSREELEKRREMREINTVLQSMTNLKDYEVEG